MLRAFLALSLLSQMHSAPDPTQNFISESEWRAESLLTVPVVPTRDPKHVAPVIDASGAIAVDLDTGEILFDRGLHSRRAIASITKVMTAIIILEENDLEDIVTVSEAASEEIGSQIYLKSGEQMTVGNMLRALLIGSANDAAYALAEYNAGSVDQFVEKMNKKARILGLYNTHFQNPVGLDHTLNYSTPYDLAILGRYAYRKPFVEETVSQVSGVVRSVDGKYTHELHNTNQLLGGYLHIEGIKTGRTDLAGLCLMAIGSNADGKKVLTVVLDSPDRFRETKVLLDWAFRAYTW